MRPNRNQLAGYSLSEFKTLLKRLGHKVPRNLATTGYVTEYNNRLYRWRWWGDVYGDDTGEFFVDVSCPLSEFDRWANSTDEVIKFSDWDSRYVDNSVFCRDK